jgi:hypothetical protein
MPVRVPWVQAGHHDECHHVEGMPGTNEELWSA